MSDYWVHISESIIPVDGHYVSDSDELGNVITSDPVYNALSDGFNKIDITNLFTGDTYPITDGATLR